MELDFSGLTHQFGGSSVESGRQERSGRLRSVGDTQDAATTAIYNSHLCGKKEKKTTKKEMKI